MIDGRVPGRPLARSFVLAAAEKRLARAFGAPAEAPARPAPARAAEPVLALDPPRTRQRSDPGALAAQLAGDLAQKLDELVYVWSVIRELEPFAAPGETELRRRAAELALVAAGGALDVPIEPLLRAARGFLDAHGMDEGYIRKLCEWYRI
jgi:hypothetical protein